MKVGLLGSGDVARSLGTGFLALGHEVCLGTRHPSRPNLADWANGAGKKAIVGTFSDAATFGEVVVLATLGVATTEAIRTAGVERFDGKVVIDATNPLVFREEGPPGLAVGHTTSGAEEVQRLLPKARVVKAFNTIGHTHFFRPSFPGGPPDMFVCGEDAGAKRTVEGILHAFGWPSVIDIGGLDGARQLEELAVLWVKTAQRLGNFNIGFKVLRR